MFATALRLQLPGRAVSVRHIRDGVELPIIATDDNYDFNFQVILLTSISTDSDFAHKIFCKLPKISSQGTIKLRIRG